VSRTHHRRLVIRLRSGRVALNWGRLFFPAASIRPLTRGNAQRCENSSLEGTMRRRSWPSRRISLPLSDFARLWSIGPSFTPPMQPRPDHVPARGPTLHKSPRPTLTQTQRLQGRRCGREREFLRLLCAGHCGPRGHFIVVPGRAPRGIAAYPPGRRLFTARY